MVSASVTRYFTDTTYPPVIVHLASIALKRREHLLWQRNGVQLKAAVNERRKYSPIATSYRGRRTAYGVATANVGQRQRQWHRCGVF